MTDNTTGFVGLREAARQLGVQPWKITYALAAGYLVEPPRVAGKRAFDQAAVERMRRHFCVAGKTANE